MRGAVKVCTIVRQTVRPQKCNEKETNNHQHLACISYNVVYVYFLKRCYFSKIFDLTNSRSNEPLFLSPSRFVRSGVDCIDHREVLISML